MTITQKCEALGITLPDAPGPMANYVSVQRAGNLLFFSGAGPMLEGKPIYKGVVGGNVSKDESYDASRIAALNLLSTLNREVQDIERIQIVKLMGFVACTSDFYDQPAVINGASDLFIEVFGDRGKHARSAVAAHVLPFNLPVEIEMIVQVTG